MKTKIKKIAAKDIEKYCRQHNDEEAYKKMCIHELKHEPVEEVMIIENGKKIPKKELENIFYKLGFKTNVILAKKHGSDGNAVMNGGQSRLHIRFFEGKKKWYLFAHIDKVKPLHMNPIKVIQAHIGSGAGDYKNGTNQTYKILYHYFQTIQDSTTSIL